MATLSILQYAVDTILFMQSNLEHAKNMKLLLCAFVKLFGLKINFHKSKLFCYGEPKELEGENSQIFCCEMGFFPFRYLGIPMHHRKLRNADWKELKRGFKRNLDIGKERCFRWGEIILINSALSNLSIFMLSFFEVPQEVLRKLDYYRSRFFWLTKCM